MKNLIIIILCLFVTASRAEEKKKRINYCTTLEEAMKLSTQRHKPIFFNCFAGWSGGSLLMDSIALQDPRLVKFIEKNFVSLRVDMVKTPEGRKLSEKYSVHFFAHFLILNSKGEIIHRIVGGSKVPEFQKHLKKGLSSKTSLAGLGKRYENGDRSLSFLSNYANALNTADEKEKFIEVTDYYLEQASTKELLKPNSWNILRKRGIQYNSKWYNFVYNHKHELIRANGESVPDFLVQGAFMIVYPIMIMQSPYNEHFITDIENKMRPLASSAESCKQLMNICHILRLRHEKKYSEMLSLWETTMTHFPDAFVEWKFDMTLPLLHDMPQQEKEKACNYLKSKLAGLEGTKLEQYRYAIQTLTDYQGIRFETGNLAEALEKASREKKPLFVDCFTSWCGPCHMMSSKVFPSKEAGDFFNPRFVSIKIDMEKGEGKELLKKWGINAFPTYLILNNQGEVIYSSQGYIPAEELIKRMQEGLKQLNK